MATANLKAQRWALMSYYEGKSSRLPPQGTDPSPPCPPGFAWGGRWAAMINGSSGGGARAFNLWRDLAPGKWVKGWTWSGPYGLWSVEVGQWTFNTCRLVTRSQGDI